MQFQQTIAQIDAELTPQRVVELWRSALSAGFEPKDARCFLLIFPSSAAMLRTVRGSSADPVVAESCTFEQMEQAFPSNARTLQHFKERPRALLIGTAVHLPMRSLGVASDDKLFTVSVSCLDPK